MSDEFDSLDDDDFILDGMYDGLDGAGLSEDQMTVLANLDDDLAGGGLDAMLDNLAATRVVFAEAMQLFELHGQADGAAHIITALANLDEFEDHLVRMKAEFPELDAMYEAERQRMLRGEG